jgi:hypothetical protein
VGGVFMVEHLGVVKLLIEKVAKYLLLPGLDLDINLNIRVRHAGCIAALVVVPIWLASMPRIVLRSSL